MNYNKKMTENEIPFRTYRYIYNSSIIQGLYGEDDETLNSWHYQNNWIINLNQRKIIKTLIYSKYEDLEELSFPINIKAIWSNNLNKIQWKEIERD